MSTGTLGRTRRAGYGVGIGALTAVAALTLAGPAQAAPAAGSSTETGMAGAAGTVDATQTELTTSDSGTAEAPVSSPASTSTDPDSTASTGTDPAGTDPTSTDPASSGAVASSPASTGTGPASSGAVASSPASASSGTVPNASGTTGSTESTTRSAADPASTTGSPVPTSSAAAAARADVTTTSTTTTAAVVPNYGIGKIRVRVESAAASVPAAGATVTLTVTHLDGNPPTEVTLTATCVTDTSDECVSQDYQALSPGTFAFFPDYFVVSPGDEVTITQTGAAAGLRPAPPVVVPPCALDAGTFGFCDPVEITLTDQVLTTGIALDVRSTTDGRLLAGATYALCQTALPITPVTTGSTTESPTTSPPTVTLDLSTGDSEPAPRAVRAAAPVACPAGSVQVAGATSNSAGRLTFPGSYDPRQFRFSVVETVAPAGYRLDPTVIALTVPAPDTAAQAAQPVLSDVLNAPLPVVTTTADSTTTVATVTTTTEAVTTETLTTDSSPAGSSTPSTTSTLVPTTSVITSAPITVTAVADDGGALANTGTPAATMLWIGLGLAGAGAGLSFLTARRRPGRGRAAHR